MRNPRSLLSSSSPVSVSLCALALACSGSNSPAASTPAQGIGSATDAAPEASGGAAPGVPRGKRAPCTLGADQSCNEDPTVSALWGRCTELGVCECKPGFERSPTTDLCRPVP